MNAHIQLPRGVWLHVSNLPVGTTEEQFSEYLRANYLDIPPDCISLVNHPYHTEGFIAVKAGVLLDLVRWALETAQPFSKLGPVRLKLPKNRSADS